MHPRITIDQKQRIIALSEVEPPGNMTQEQIASVVKVSRKTVNEVLRDHRKAQEVAE